MHIIPATAHHVPAIQRIYAWHVLHGSATFETEPPDVEEMQNRLSALLEKGGIWLVALEKHQVIGYCYLAPYRPRYAYRFTLEDSIYLDPECTGRGAGRALLTEAIRLAEARGFRQIVAVIAGNSNQASIGLHRALGFRETGVLKAVGFKHGRWLDTHFMQRELGEGSNTSPE
ncbi:N-acetyltransferase family protein [Pantoea sp. ACRSB]|uniref:GNAT family N-acetyltransferase n=1 Tax=Pantoea sp. ACRSB TaxID=2918207 RepID=UPI00289356D6|nr:N-acetyltransferase family protein [Pantoea sp. ACRSB]MCG7389591.1 N-acetyltransferase family protein [Pantoea sp. ACRSB]